jgi:hypothetical protein
VTASARASFTHAPRQESGRYETLCLNLGGIALRTDRCRLSVRRRSAGSGSIGGGHSARVRYSAGWRSGQPGFCETEFRRLA